MKHINSISHRIIKCRNCEHIIEQCECMDKSKNVEYNVCGECAKKGIKNTMGGIRRSENGI